MSESKRAINIKFTNEEKEQIDILTSVLGVPKSQFIKNLVLQELEANKEVIETVKKARDNLQK